ncbi:MAG: hypothetical protein P8Q37_03630 [Porticoccaceae bacterium]|nr:hypothetical protein [Porticoccaceae bacterium]MDG1473968.1 hypothetical protein [Porticoccaceae bacterium]
MVIRGGKNIGCGKVEVALLEHPSVCAACACTVPSERVGEEVGATLKIFLDNASLNLKFQYMSSLLMNHSHEPVQGKFTN